MLVYTVLLLLPLSWLVTSGRSAETDRRTQILTIVALTAFVGLRYQVGGDWDNYLDLLRASRNEPLGSALLRHDPGYRLLSFLVAQAGGNIALVNLVCAALFVTGLVAFCWMQAERALALLIATPVLIATMALAATRQSAAIGLVMAAAAAFLGGKRRPALLLLLVAPTFHWTAFAAWPLAWLAGAKTNGTRTAVICGIAIGILLDACYLSMSELQMFVDLRGVSRGAAFRAALHIPALVATIGLLRSESLPGRERALINASLPCLILVLAVLPLMPTVSDRMGFYLVPLQMLALSRGIAMLKEARPGGVRIATFATVIVYLGFFLGWLSLTHNSACNVPYRSYLQGRDFRFSAVLDQYRSAPDCALGA
jgi:hypothetical protein